MLFIVKINGILYISERREERSTESSHDGSLRVEDVEKTGIFGSENCKAKVGDNDVPLVVN